MLNYETSEIGFNESGLLNSEMLRGSRSSWIVHLLQMNDEKVEKL